MGLDLLYPTEADTPTTSTVDLILIHGLHGDAIKSWTNPDTKAFWPRDFLPLDIPQARVFTFGYDADAVFGSTTANIVDHAKDLLSSLVDEREEEPERTRPIIFIAHSLGGIVAKQALFSASIERQYYCIKESTLGVVFFGTPHRGSDKSEYGKVLADIASKMMNAPRSALLQALKTNSHTLLQLTTDFRHQLPQYHVVTFYETKPLRPFKDLIVAKESALLNTDGEDQIPVNKDHRAICKFARRDDETYKKLIKRIGRITKAQTAIQTSIQQGSYNLPFSVPFSRNLDFVGRDVVLKDLQRILFHTPGLQHAAVFGLGGVGKTQVALRIAYWVKDNRPDHSVFWVSALSHAAFEQSYGGIINEAGLQRDDAEDPKQTVQRHLNSDKAGQWFLIIDNVDDQDIAYTINNYLPHGEGGRILFTTRTKTVATSLARGNYINLLEMSSTESKSFFRSAIHQKELLENELGVDDLLQHLTHLPLAIRQASAYINENGIGIADYLRLFNNDPRNRAELIGSNFLDKTRKREDNALSITWHLSFDQISKKDATAVRLLEFIACIEPKAIPRSLLSVKGFTEPQIVRALGTLCGYSFLSKRDDDVYDMHSLVYTAVELWVGERSDRETQEMLKGVIEHFVEVLPAYHWINTSTWRQCTPHVLKVLQKFEGPYLGASSALYRQVGDCLARGGRIKEAILQLTRLVQIEAKTLAKDHPDRLTSLHQLANAYGSNLQIQDAIQLLEHVVGIRAQTLPEDHPDTLKAQHDLIGIYMDNGQMRDSIQLFEQVLEVETGALTQDHPRRLALQHRLALAYLRNGQNRDAIQLMQHVVEVEAKTLAENDRGRLISQDHLAVAYLQNDQIHDAIQLLEHDVGLWVKTVGEYHPWALDSRHDLAGAYLKNGQIHDAIQLLERVVKKGGKVLEGDDEDYRILALERELAGAYVRNGQNHDAIQLLEHLVKALNKIFTEDDPVMLDTQYLLATAYTRNGQTPDAIQVLEHVVEVEALALTEDHSDRLTSQHELAAAYMKNGQNRDAIQLLEYLAEIDAIFLPVDHPKKGLAQSALERARMGM